MPFLLFVAACFFAIPAQAYVGPGAAIALVGTLFGFSAAVATSIAFVIAWPAYKLYQWHKKRKNQEQ